MAQVLKFDEAISRGSAPSEPHADSKTALRERLAEEERDDFWPEVSSGLWVKQPIPVNPANSPQRVLTEVMLILGAAGLLVLLTTIFIGTPNL